VLVEGEPLQVKDQHRGEGLEGRGKAGGVGWGEKGGGGQSLRVGALGEGEEGKEGGLGRGGMRKGKRVGLSGGVVRLFALRARPKPPPRALPFSASPPRAPPPPCHLQRRLP
jgi:hypothetical protein